LKYLDLGSNQIDDISVLRDLNGLERLILNYNRISDITPLSNLSRLKFLDMSNNLISDVSPLAGLTKLTSLALLNNCIMHIVPIEHFSEVTGESFQHNSCENPQIVRRKFTKDWLDAQMEKQCVDFGDNDFSLKSDYSFFPDGIYYTFFSGYVGKSRGFSCRLPWGSKLDDIIIPLEKVGDSSTIEKYKLSHQIKIFVLDGKIKGTSRPQGLTRGYNSKIEELMDIFKVKYDIKETRVNDRDALLAIKKDHVIREISGDKFNTLQFFEADFFNEKVTEIK
jgi:hypothetical protein